MTGIYVHVPFCNGKCPYCDFYSITAAPPIRQIYVNAVLKELEERKLEGKNGADTLYLGGGTPTLLSDKQIADIVSKAAECYDLQHDAEVTIEANPQTLTPKKLDALKAAGINRLSIGLQSAVQTELAALGRKHTAKQVLDAVHFARLAGFENISVDCMLAIARQTSYSLNQTLEFIANLNIEHCSCYLLKIEKNTPFGANPPLLPDDEHTADLYLQAVNQLQNMGLRQYEISNFAKPGFESRHNLKYWMQQRYLGIGAAAHSFDGANRFAHSRNISQYSKKTVGDITNCAPGADASEWLMLRLRLSKGVTLNELAQKNFDINTIQKKAQKLRQEKLVQTDTNCIALTPRGFLVQNAIVLYLLS